RRRRRTSAPVSAGSRAGCPRGSGRDAAARTCRCWTGRRPCGARTGSPRPGSGCRRSPSRRGSRRERPRGPGSAFPCRTEAPTRTVALVEIGAAHLGGDVVRVGGPDLGATDLRLVVRGLGEGEGAQEPEALAQVLAELHLQRVELRLAPVLDGGESAVLGI